MLEEFEMGRVARISLGSIAFLTLAVFGCADDVDPTAPQVGTITIDAEPNSISAPWSLAGPDGLTETGTGDRTFSSLSVGPYTLTWREVSGWTSPNPTQVTQTLSGGGSLAFSGMYVLQTGTITIDAEPDSIRAPWTLTGPGGFSEAGTGNRALSNMSAGSYTLTWLEVAGWTLPNPTRVTQTLSPDASLTFSGVYIQQLGTITIDAEPDSIRAPWTLTGPGNYVLQGTGDLTLPGRAAGDYTLTWGSVADWNLLDPTVQTRTLQGGSHVLFRGVYVEADPGPPEGFVYIAPGTFTMGSPESEPRWHPEETQHTVTLTHGFYMSKYEVTEQLWAEVMGGKQTTSQLPKNQVSWDMAVQFCNALSARERLTPAYRIVDSNGDVVWNRGANGYRLPTEAEWEYACRAGTTTAFHNGTNCLSSSTEANYNGNHPLTGCPSGTSRGARTNVGSFPANAWGLHDLHGNVFEWVWDTYRTDYQNLPATDPVHDMGPGSSRVIRGGSWRYSAFFCRSAFRSSLSPTFSGDMYGLRLVRTVF